MLFEREIQCTVNDLSVSGCENKMDSDNNNSNNVLLHQNMVHSNDVLQENDTSNEIKGGKNENLEHVDEKKAIYGLQNNNLFGNESMSNSDSMDEDDELNKIDEENEKNKQVHGDISKMKHTDDIFVDGGVSESMNESKLEQNDKNRTEEKEEKEDIGGKKEKEIKIIKHDEIEKCDGKKLDEEDDLKNKKYKKEHKNEQINGKINIDPIQSIGNKVNVQNEDKTSENEGIMEVQKKTRKKSNKSLFNNKKDIETSENDHETSQGSIIFKHDNKMGKSSNGQKQNETTKKDDTPNKELIGNKLKKSKKTCKSMKDNEMSRKNVSENDVVQMSSDDDTESKIQAKKIQKKNDNTEKISKKRKSLNEMNLEELYKEHEKVIKKIELFELNLDKSKNISKEKERRYEISKNKKAKFFSNESDDVDT